MLFVQQDESKSGLQTRLQQRERVMDNIVQVNKDLYLNIAETVKIESHGKNYRISIRNSTGRSPSLIAILRRRGTTN
jgi:hypothetical protein